MAECGLAAVSPSLLSLCVDVKLVCAEGYTQVTGVIMAMMMTGRVLLVCVLCVLWCGAGSSNAEEDMVLLWYRPTKEDCNTKSTREGKLNESAFKKCMYVAMKEICDTDDADTSSESRSTEAEEVCKTYAGDPDRAPQTSTPQDQPSSDVETPVAVTHSETPRVDAAEMGSTLGEPAGESPANTTEGQPRTSAATDTANNSTDEGGKVVISKNAPESNTIGKGEEKLGKKKDNNTNETPVKAKPMKNTTTPGDSDGSTAVSHTTFPLLLLLLVCAAAAAVVAA
ncbi:mucin-associated surface protein (MASP), putative [Trypanosoma cruzi marinkellei]|uniref:Mucin-associated surface protein (MASP), putative n=1 Tax=Trypanosoma cruzi marinkellei TaxID=85056 RepID=K2M701_TRYCR|nr:mucin-associated surface protein (MASP), putative [Trypanosoma cruzi marinkellei]